MDYFKIVCYPPSGMCEPSPVYYYADDYIAAKHISAWYTQVEWESYSASTQIVRITEKEYLENK